MGYIELISVIMGFAFQIYANQQAALNNALQRSISQGKADNSNANDAGKRVTGYGVWVRRFIVISIVLSFVYFPFFSAYSNMPQMVEVKTTIGGYFWGLWPKRIIVDFIPITGYLMQDDTKEIMKAIMFFYFGKSGAKAA